MLGYFVHAQSVQKHGGGRSESRFGYLRESPLALPVRATRHGRARWPLRGFEIRLHASSDFCVVLFASARGGLESGLELRIREKMSAHILTVELVGTWATDEYSAV